MHFSAMTELFLDISIRKQPDVQVIHDLGPTV
jgi:hypothetical protein